MSSPNQNEEHEQKKQEELKKQTKKSSNAMKVTMPEELEEEEVDRSIGMVANRYHGAEAHSFEPMEAIHVGNMTRMNLQNMAKNPEFQLQTPFKLDTKLKLESKMVCDIDYSDDMMMEDTDDQIEQLDETEFNKTTAVVSGNDKDELLKAIQNTHQVLQSDTKKQIRHQQFEEDGYGFDVDYTHKKRSPLTAQAEVLILEIPDTHPNQSFHGCYCILYQHMNGSKWAFQRYFRESVEKLQQDLKDLRPLCGKSLPTMDVFGKDDADLDKSSPENVEASLTISLQVLQSLELIGFTCESLQEITDTLQNIASKNPALALQWAQKNTGVHKAFKVLLENVDVGAFRDAKVVRNVLRFYSSILMSTDDFNVLFMKSAVCKTFVEDALFSLMIQRSEYWVTQDKVGRATAEAVCDDIATFMTNVDRDYLSQGAQLPQSSGSLKQTLQRIIAAKNDGFGSFRKTCSTFLSQL